MAVLSKNVENVRKLFIETIALMSNENWTPIIKSNQVEFYIPRTNKKSYRKR